MRTRDLLAFAFSIIVLAVPGIMGGQGATEPPFRLTQVGPNVWAAISNPTSGARSIANTGFVIGDDGVAVIDTTISVDADGHFRPEPAQQVLAAIRAITPLPVRFVINTHHHFDHVAANEVFATTGALVLAHRNVRRWIHSEHLRLMNTDTKAEHRAFMEGLVPPTVTYDQRVDLHLGARMIQVQHVLGHTGGDSVVVIPDAKVVFAGDLFWRDIVPNLVDASTQPWIDTLDALVKTESGATFVPGHGDVGTAKDVAALRDYLVTLRRLVSEAQARTSGEALADAVLPGLRGQYGNWTAFASSARPNILQTDAELRGTKRIPQAEPGK